MSHDTLNGPHTGQRRIVTSVKPSAPKPPAPARKFFPEVQGLRAVAVLMVVAYHVWFGRISGGVDIFLLVSSFLMTGQFVRKLESGRALELFGYWSRLFKRLLPLIVVTLLATLAATWLFVPRISWTSIIQQGWASLLYYQNWFLAAESVDYYATDHSLASPLQHFWSLSIQGQIFILWPLLFALVALAAKKLRLKLRPLLVLTFGTIFTVSLIFSIITTHSNQQYAYFDTRTRLWEFAFGSLLALLLPHLNFRTGVRVALGWIGVVAMLSCGFILQVGQQFPGYMALWPTVAGACVIVAGHAGKSYGADRALSWPLLVKLGDSSYALYLIHWPVLVIFLVVSGRQQAGVISGLLVVLGSMIAALLATKYIDTPLRRNAWLNHNRRRALMAIAVCVALAATPLTAWQHQLRAASAAAAAQLPSDNPGALTLLPGYRGKISEGAAVLPALDNILEDFPRYAVKCGGADTPEGSTLTANCTQDGVLDGTAKESVVVVGNSHADHLSGAVRSLANNQQWKVTKVLGLGCVFGVDTTAEDDRCTRFNAEAMAYILKVKPDRVFTISTHTSEKGPDEVVVPGYEDTVATLTDAGISVVGIRDNPRFAFNMPQCSSSNESDFAQCEVALETVMPTRSPMDTLAVDDAHFFPVDMTDLICPQGLCRPIIGNDYVFIDSNHVSQTYWNSMAGEFERRLAVQPGW